MTTNPAQDIDMFEIQSGIPLPATKRSGSTYKFGQMGVGDSFFVPFGEEEYKRVVARVRGACGVYRTNHPEVKFTVRTVDEDQGSGVRVWRIE